MRILFFGDVFARPGREAVLRHLPELRARLAPDVMIINVENAATGNGVTLRHAQLFWDAGFACLTSGNHIWRQKEIITHIDAHPRLLRPINYPGGTPGQGAYVHTLSDGRRVLVANIMGQVNMTPTLDCPFAAAEQLVAAYPLGQAVQASVIDFHAETTAEKACMGHFCDGRVSAVLGTHTHIPTADDHILEKGTAYQTDVGMCGDFNSSIGVRKDIIMRRMVRKIAHERFEPALGEATVCATLVVTDDQTGLAKSIETFRVGGALTSKTP